jgi:bifunctional DNase/RNase
MTPSRPLTHDLFKTFSKEFEFDVKEIIIYNLIEGIFFSKLICTNKEGKEIEIDTRTSDAIAIAVRFNSPIYAYEFILSSAGILLEEEDIDSDSISDEEPDGMVIEIEGTTPKKEELSITELEKSLQSAIENEDYENASKIRDEITKRQSNQGEN